MTGLDLFVESTVQAFNLDWDKKKIRIDVTSPWGDKQRISIVATGIDDCRIDEMRLYNILDRVTLYREEESQKPGSECASLLFFLMQNREPTANDLEWPAVREKLALIQSGELTLLAIEAVYGATFLVLAKSITIEWTT